MTDQPIGRRVWLEIPGALGADSEVEDALVEAVVHIGLRRGVNIDYASGPLFEDGDETDRKLARYRSACHRMSHEIDQILGKALGYPAHDPEQTGGSPDEVCTGEHVPETLAVEAAGRIGELTAARDELRAKLLVRILDRNRLHETLDYILHRGGHLSAAREGLDQLRREKAARAVLEVIEQSYELRRRYCRARESGGATCALPLGHEGNHTTKSWLELVVDASRRAAEAKFGPMGFPE